MLRLWLLFFPLGLSFELSKWLRTFFYYCRCTASFLFSLYFFYYTQIIAYFFDRYANKSNAMIELVLMFVCVCICTCVNEEDSYESAYNTISILAPSRSAIRTHTHAVQNACENVPMSDFNRSFNFKASDFDLWFCSFFFFFFSLVCICILVTAFILLSFWCRNFASPKNRWKTGT